MFLDESEKSRSITAKTIRGRETVNSNAWIFQTLKANVRVLSATNADLKAEVEQGRFRQDLLFRLNTVELHLPPLRDRKEDIPALAEHFLRQHRERYRRPIMGLTEEAFAALGAHSWPGNVRELTM